MKNINEIIENLSDDELKKIPIDTFINMYLIMCECDKKYRFNFEYFKFILKKNRKTMKEVQEAVGLKQTALYKRVRSDPNCFTLKEAIAMSELLNISLIELFCPSNEQFLALIV